MRSESPTPHRAGNGHAAGSLASTVMTTPGTGHGLPTWRRLLLVLPLLLGVLVMHGLTSNHDIGMSTAAGATGHSHSRVAPGGQGGGHPAMAMGGSDNNHTAAPAAIAAGDADQQAGHDMGPVCLGILTISVLALALASGRGWPSGRLLLPMAVLSTNTAPTSGALSAPSLTRLCISRT